MQSDVVFKVSEGPRVAPLHFGLSVLAPGDGEPDVACVGGMFGDKINQ